MGRSGISGHHAPSHLVLLPLLPQLFQVSGCEGPGGRNGAGKPALTLISWLQNLGQAAAECPTHPGKGHSVPIGEQREDKPTTTPKVIQAGTWSWGTAGSVQNSWATGGKPWGRDSLPSGTLLQIHASGQRSDTLQNSCVHLQPKGPGLSTCSQATVPLSSLPP